MSKIITAEKNGLRRPFGSIQWDHLRTKDGNHDGWIEVDPSSPVSSGATTGEVKKPFIPKEIASRDNTPKEEKAALSELHNAINGGASAEAPSELSAEPEISEEVEKEMANKAKAGIKKSSNKNK